MRRRRWGDVWLGLGLVAALAGCNGQSGATATANGIAPGQAAWCGPPAILFTDEGANPPAAVTSWATAQPALGFAPLLPARLPAGACLEIAGGTLHDPTFGGRFIITYRLPGGGALSLAEAPKLADQPQPTCTTAPGATPTVTCAQSIGAVSVTASSTLAQPQLVALFADLRAGLAWVPAGTPATLPLPATAGP